MAEPDGYYHRDIEKSSNNTETNFPVQSLYDQSKPLYEQKYKTIFSDDEHRRYFFDHLDLEGFSKFLNRLNGGLRGIEREKWNKCAD